jgi:probable O-glycosylation ligase (exosortase A-associated)
MRDLLVVGIVLLGALIALRRPWIGVMLWCWVSLMNPHRYAWGFAYEAPVAAIVAIATIAGLLFTRERASPFKGAAPVILAILMAWITVSWLMGLDREGDYAMWDKVMKIYLMVLVSLALLHSKQHIFALAWVCAGSLALLGVKGGLFTFMTGGGYRVWGPPLSFIADNNHFALALVMTIPLLRFLQMQLSTTWARHGMTLAMVLVAAAALGTHSRGAILAMAAMALLLWWRGRNLVLGGFVIASAGLALIAFMPEHWMERMESIGSYQEDRSAIGRISAWWVAWRLAFDYPFGVGFEASRPFLFALYSPYPELGTPAAHSIYFQVLGHHGFVGLALFLLLWWVTWRTADRIRKEAAGIAEARWCSDLAGMCQVSLAGYFVGGAFLSLSYFDLPYYVMALLVLTRAWLRKRAWETEPAYKPGWLPVLGLAAAKQSR